VIPVGVQIRGTMGPCKRLAGEDGWRMELPLRSLRDGYRFGY